MFVCYDIKPKELVISDLSEKNDLEDNVTKLYFSKQNKTWILRSDKQKQIKPISDAANWGIFTSKSSSISGGRSLGY